MYYVYESIRSICKSEDDDGESVWVCLNDTAKAADTTGDWEFIGYDAIEKESYGLHLESRSVYGRIVSR